MTELIISVIATISLTLGVGTTDIEKMDSSPISVRLTQYEEAVTELVKYYLPPIGPIDMDKEFFEDIYVDSYV